MVQEVTPCFHAIKKITSRALYSVKGSLRAGDVIIPSLSFWRIRSSDKIKKIEMVWMLVGKEIANENYDVNLMIIASELGVQFLELRGFVW